MRTRPKRSDLPTAAILAAIDRKPPGGSILDELPDWPTKVVYAAVMRDSSRGHIEWGVVWHRCWRTDQHLRDVRAITGKYTADRT